MSDAHPIARNISHHGELALLTPTQMAAAGAAAAIGERWPMQQGIILYGPGNNGGDAFVVARHQAASRAGAGISGPVPSPTGSRQGSA